MDNLGLFIKQTRNEKNLSQEEVANEAGLARSYVSRLEDGNYKAPSVMTLIRLAKGLGVSNERLFAEAGISIREGQELPELDVYCRTKYSESELPDEAIKQVQDYVDLQLSKYANNNKQQGSADAR
jgi:transcriptional regulator with XRE-family HTH domain